MFKGEMWVKEILDFCILLKGKDAMVSKHRALKKTIRNAFTSRKIWWQNQRLILEEQSLPIDYL